MKAVKRDKEGHYIMITGSIKEEDITIINIYAPNIGALQYVRQMLTSLKGKINKGAPQYVRQMLTSLKGEINNNTAIVGDFNTQIDRSTKQKINKEIQIK